MAPTLKLLLSLLLISGVTHHVSGAAITASSHVIQRFEPSSSRQIRTNRGPLSNSVLMIPRGGGTVRRSVDAPPMVEKLRNVIRSCLEISQRKSPSLNKIFLFMVQLLESVIGYTLLPSGETVEMKVSVNQDEKRKKKRKKSSPQIPYKTNINPEPKKSSEIVSPSKASIPPKSKTTSKTSSATLRIQSELKSFLKSPPPNLRVHVKANMRVWIITVKPPANSIFSDETFRLRVSIPPQYPMVPPSVYFLQPTPRHEHVYTNGDICLSLLGSDWRPTLTVQSIALAILSMLGSAREKSIPMDNSKHCGNKPGGTQDNWIYHDDNC